MQVQKTAIELLNDISKKRKWYYFNEKPIFSNQYAREIKLRLKNNSLTNDSATKILINLGWNKIEIWQHGTL